MARYRKIDPRIWNDQDFRRLSDNAKLLFLFLLTHPHLTPLGAMRATISGLSEELGWPQEVFRKAFVEVRRKPFVKVDETASFLAIPNFLKYNPPENPNVLKSWDAAVDYIPECRMKIELMQYVKAFAEGFGEAFAKALPKGVTECARTPFRETGAVAGTEAEAGKKEERLSGNAVKPLPGPSPEIFTELPCRGKGPKIFTVTREYIDSMKPLYPAVDIEKETLLAKGWLLNNPHKGKTYGGMKSFLGRWYQREQNRGNGVHRESEKQSAQNYLDGLLQESEREAPDGQ